MFTVALALATLASAQIESASCTLVADLSTWDLRTMQKPANTSYYSSGSLTWNLCQYIKYSETNVSAQASSQGLKDATFAYQFLNNTITPLTSEILPTASAHMDSKNNIDGITYVFTSSNQCSFNNTLKAGFQNTVLCDKSITGEGAGQIVNVTDENSCLPKVTMKHADGCAEWSAQGLVKFFNDNVWLSGTIMVIVGAIMVFFGQAFFRYVMGMLGALTGFLTILYFSSLFGWLNATWSLITLICIAVVVGCVCGVLIFLSIPVCIGLLGVAAGFFGASTLFAVIVATTGYDALWLLITMIVLFCIMSGVLAFKFSKGFLSFGTAFVGGYMFMRGTTLWFGHYPSEMEMWQMMANGETVDLGWQFWLYFATFIGVSIFGWIWQLKFYNKSDSALDDYHQSRA